MELITDLGGESHFIATIKNQLCYPCNKSISFIILKQVLNYKVHTLGKQPLGYDFGMFLYAGILLYLRRIIQSLCDMAFQKSSLLIIIVVLKDVCLLYVA